MIVHVFLTSLISAALLVHALLGCCWHHTHRCPRELGAPAVADHGHDCSSACLAGERHGSECGLDHGKHQRGNGCQGVRCVFIAAQPGPTCQAPAVPDHGTTATIVLMEASPAASPCYGTFSAASACPLPLRIHLLHQVLLL